LELGTFSVSLAVKDIEASKQFYAKLVFGKSNVKGTALISKWINSLTECPANLAIN
jgi:predicted lactoylglutathione lyase